MLYIKYFIKIFNVINLYDIVLVGISAFVFNGSF